MGNEWVMPCGIPQTLRPAMNQVKGVCDVPLWHRAQWLGGGSMNRTGQAAGSSGSKRPVAKKWFSAFSQA